MHRGCILLWRKIKDCLALASIAEVGAWVWLLMNAASKDKVVTYQRKQIALKRGQLATSVRQLSGEFGWSRRRVKTFLEGLQGDDSGSMIRIDPAVFLVKSANPGGTPEHHPDSSKPVIPGHQTRHQTRHPNGKQAFIITLLKYDTYNPTGEAAERFVGHLMRQSASQSRHLGGTVERHEHVNLKHVNKVNLKHVRGTPEHHLNSPPPIQYDEKGNIVEDWR